MSPHLLIHFLLHLGPGGQAVEIEHEGGGGGGEPVTEQGETDHRHVLQGEGGARQEVGEQVELLLKLIIGIFFFEIYNL